MPPLATAENFTYDVFISYSHQDEAWVEKTLLPRLEAAGLKVCIDFRDFSVGKPALFNMQDAVKGSRHTLLILTEHWVASEWSTFEAILARTKDPAGLQQRTIPLRLRACEPDDAISMLTWVDFTRLDREAIAWRQLLTALGKPPPQETPATPTPVHWQLVHPYPMPPNFTGRLAERQGLSDWLTHDTAHPLLVLRALGGFGKSALTWHWLTHDVDATHWPQVIWWSFYEANSSFESFVRETLLYLNIDPATFRNTREQTDELLKRLARPGLLLILDGFERALRAFSSMSAAYQGDEVTSHPAPGPLPLAPPSSDLDCVSPLAEHFLRNFATRPGLRGKVLMTTRLTPRILTIHGELLQGCSERELRQLAPEDAVTFFHSQGVRGSRAEIEAACAPYGYHPLSLRLLSGLVVKDLRQPGDINVTKRLDITGDLVQRQHHVLEQAYGSLPPARQQLLSRIACFRSPVSYEALEAIASMDEESNASDPIDAALHDLLDRGLLQRDIRSQRFDLHPIVRRYAYAHLADAQRRATHGQLQAYFFAIEIPQQVQTLEELTPVLERYHHTVNAGKYDEAFKLYRDRIHNAAYYQFGAYQLQIELLRALFPESEKQLPRLAYEGYQAWTLSALANSYSLSGQLQRAVPLFERQISIREKQGNKQNLAVGLVNLADAQLKLGSPQIAEANLRKSINLCGMIEDRDEAIGHRDLGQLLAYRGVWMEAANELATALTMFKEQNHVQMQGVICTYQALRALLLARSTTRAQQAAPLPAALSFAHRALELADEWQKQVGRPNARDYVRAHWLLGAAQCANSDHDAAERHLTEALTRCRSINAVEAEANILLDLARLRRDQGQRAEALRLAEEAQLITERSEYVLQGADVHLFLAERALADGDRVKALAYARTARQLATCDGPPDYTYKVAYDEAGALLAQLGDA